MHASTDTHNCGSSVDTFCNEMAGVPRHRLLRTNTSIYDVDVQRAFKRPSGCPIDPAESRNIQRNTVGPQDLPPHSEQWQEKTEGRTAQRGVDQLEIYGGSTPFAPDVSTPTTPPPSCNSELKVIFIRCLDTVRATTTSPACNSELEVLFISCRNAVRATTTSLAVHGAKKHNVGIIYWMESYIKLVSCTFSTIIFYSIANALAMSLYLPVLGPDTVIQRFGWVSVTSPKTHGVSSWFGSWSRFVISHYVFHLTDQVDDISIPPHTYSTRRFSYMKHVHV
jgi:hypothetical protein